MEYKKLEILQQSKMIDEHTFLYAKKTIQSLEKQGFNVQGDKVQTFITHLVMAIARQQKGESMEEILEIVKEDLRQQENYEQAFILAEKIMQAAPVLFVEAEKDYVYLHMSNLLAEKE